MSPSALGVGQGSEQWLNKKNRGALVFDGMTIRRIEKIESKGYHNKYSLIGLIISVITGTRNINVHFSQPIPYSLTQLKTYIVDLLASKSDSGWLDNITDKTRVADNVGLSSNFIELLEYLELPNEEDCLDIL
jgi:hypothetical protein